MKTHLSFIAIDVMLIRNKKIIFIILTQFYAEPISNQILQRYFRKFSKVLVFVLIVRFLAKISGLQAVFEVLLMQLKLPDSYS